ncbi:MAG TPA: acyl-CoA dehydrogenase [Gammaproteobacteria bacterium]
MLTFLLTGTLIIFIAFSYLRLPLIIWALGYFILLLVSTFLFDSGMITRVIPWTIYILFFVPLLVPFIRRNLLTKPIFALYKQQLPTMSLTEKIALEAGTVWWDRDLFSGKPDWEKLLNYPAPVLTDEERQFIDGPVREACNMIDDWKVTHKDLDLQPEVWDYLARNRIFAMIIPKQYGGLGFSAQAHSAVVMKFATRSVTAAVSVMVPNSLGPGMLLMEYGTEQQKEYYLPRLADGTDIPCFALTSPEAGSDAASMTDHGVVCYGEHDGKKDVLGIRLTWNKRYITLAPIATLLGLAFKLYDPNHLVGEDDEPGITLALIPTNHPGIHIGNRHKPLNVPFQNGPTSGEDVFIPMDWVIGGKERVGQGWRMLMECLSDGRSISLPALSVGVAKLASNTSGAYARVRQQFNVSIGEFEGVQERLARIAGLTYLMDSARTLVLTALDEGEKPSVLSAVVKYHLTESTRTVINDAMDVHGGKGIMLGEKNYIANIYDCLPIGITVEGANILTRSMMIFGQGAIRCHPYVLDEIKAAAEEDINTGLHAFDNIIFSHVGFVISNIVRTFLLAVSYGHFHQPGMYTGTRKYYQQLMRMNAAYAMLVDFSMLILGGSLKRKENLSARLGDIFSYSYLATAALKRFHDQGQKHEDLVLLKWSVEYSLYQIQEAMYGFLDNFPLRSLALALKRLIFPLGRSFSPVSDRLNSKVAHIILSDSEARDRLTAGMFMPDDATEQVAVLEEAFKQTVMCTPVIEKLRRFARENKLNQKNILDVAREAIPVSLISEQDFEQLEKLIELRNKVIAVDDFTTDEFSNRNNECSSVKQAIV